MNKMFCVVFVVFVVVVVVVTNCFKFNHLDVFCLQQGLIFKECECDCTPSHSSKLSQERVSLHASAI